MVQVVVQSKDNRLTLFDGRVWGARGVQNDQEKSTDVHEHKCVLGGYEYVNDICLTNPHLLFAIHLSLPGILFVSSVTESLTLVQDSFSKRIWFGVTSSISSSPMYVMCSSTPSRVVVPISLPRLSAGSACLSMPYLCKVNIQVAITRVLTNNHTFVNVYTRPDKKLASRLKQVQAVCRGFSAFRSDQLALC